MIVFFVILKLSLKFNTFFCFSFLMFKYVNYIKIKNLITLFVFQLNKCSGPPLINLDKKIN